MIIKCIQNDLRDFEYRPSILAATRQHERGPCHYRRERRPLPCNGIGVVSHFRAKYQFVCTVLIGAI